MTKIGLSTSSFYPSGVETTFKVAKELGYDGLEIMVSQDPLTRDPNRLQALSKKYSLPILSVHAPTLLLTHFVWGQDPKMKLEKASQLAVDLDCETVVVHPPFTWQRNYSIEFLSLVETLSQKYKVNIAVENMFSWKVGEREVKAYSPSWDLIKSQASSLTLDFSHAALSGLDSYSEAAKLADKIKHIHLCDGRTAVGVRDRVFDEHLIPGDGDQPVAQTLQLLRDKSWAGTVVAEVNTQKLLNRSHKLEALKRTLAFAKENLG